MHPTATSWGWKPTALPLRLGLDIPLGFATSSPLYNCYLRSSQSKTGLVAEKIQMASAIEDDQRIKYHRDHIRALGGDV